MRQRRHRRHRLSVRVSHEGRIQVSSCDECVDPAEAIRILDRIREHLLPLVEVDDETARVLFGQGGQPTGEG